MGAPVELFLHRKQLALESLDPSGASHLPFDEVEAEGTMLSYGYVLPFGEQRFVDTAEVSYLMDDQYCVKTDCRCAEGVVTLLSRPRSLGRGSDRQHPLTPRPMICRSFLHRVIEAALVSASRRWR